METKLKTCPFCGDEAMLVEDGELSPVYKVFCLSCDAEYGWCTSRKEAINGWNKRVDEDNETVLSCVPPGLLDV